jgi:CheY-like chemotaxis protein
MLDRHVKCFFHPLVNSKKILLVDDDAVFVRGMSTILSGEGFEVIIAEDGASTVNALRDAKPDLILMDIHFPPDVEHDDRVSWDAFAIMDWLRCVGGEANNAPVILLTAADQAEYVERARKAGAMGLFQKTVETAELMGVIHQLLD